MVLAAAGSLLQVAAKEDTRVEEIVTRLGKLTGEVFSLEQKIDTIIDPKRMQRGLSLRARVDALAGSSCDDEHYQCGGNDPQCISNLLVCDGEKDCRNGEDEKHCDVPLKKGDTFVGDKVFDHCGLLNPEHITIKINSVTTSAFFTSHPKLTATLSIHTDREDEERHVTVVTGGFYSFATHEVVFNTPEEDNLYVIGHFDGHNFDRFVGDSVSVGTGEACAQYIYQRQH